MKGHTLIDLLVVLVVVSILSAIALPFYLLITNRAKSIEAYGNLRAANNAQMVYFLKHGAFAPNADALEAGTPTESPNFVYSVSGDQVTGDIEAKPKGALIVGYRGCVFADTSAGNGAIVIGGLGQSPPPCKP